jgi:exosortase A
MKRKMPTTWRLPLLLVLLSWTLILGLHASTAESMAAVWNQSETYAHGWVVPPIVLWMMWRQRGRVWALVPAPAWSALLPLGAAALLWLAGEMVSVNTSTHLALVSMVVLAVPALLGWQVARALIFPLGFLFMAVPAGDFLLPQLMSWTADFTIVALRVSGVPVYREGLHFIIPSGAWSVVEACSGIRYLVASIMAGCLYGYLNYRSTIRRVVFVLFSILVALIANWLRAYLIVMLGHYSGNALATGVDHLIYGWVFFGVVLALLFWIGARWADPDPDPNLDLAPSLAGGAAPQAPTGAASPLGAYLPVVFAGAMVVGAPHALHLAFRQHIQTGPVVMAPLVPAQGWAAAPLPSDWRPAFQGASASGQAAYRQAGGPVVGLHLAYYRNQDARRKLVSTVNVLIETKDERWAKVSEEVVEASVAGQALPVREVLLRASSKGLSADAQRLLTWHVYWVNGQLTASQVKAKLLGAWQLARGQGDDGAIVTVYTDQVPEQAARAPEALARFLDANGAAILAALNQSRRQD